MSKVHNERFTAHENLIIQVIERQAGTLSKAILEAVMNAVDAKATKVDIKIEEGIVVVNDDGHGFDSVAQIQENFRTFGQPHELDDNGTPTDAKYGTFRIGRGQMFTFGINLWDSNEFTLEVDFRHKGLDFLIKEHPKKNHAGCKIRIALYQELNHWALNNTVDELSKFCRYVSIPVTINGKLVSVDPATQEWDHDTDCAWVKLNARQGRGIEVYNMGVYVETIWSGDYGCSGTVVSKRGLKLNTARNQVIRSCKEWQAITALLRGVGNDIIKRKKKLDPNEITAVWAQLVAGTMEYRDARELRLFTDTNRGTWSFKDLVLQSSATSAKRKFELSASGRLQIAFAEHGDRLADSMMQHEHGIVLDEEVLSQARVTEPEFLMLLRKFEGRTNSNLMIDVVSLDKLAKGKSDRTHTTIDPRQYTSKEKRLINFINSDLAPRVCCMREPRRVVLGKSDTAEGWTDGRSYIAINRDFLNRRGSGAVSDWASIVLLLGHEYQHDFDSGVGHTHDEHFYQAYHDWSVTSAPTFVRAAYEGFLQVLKSVERSTKGYGHQRADKEEWRKKAMAKLEEAEA